MKKVNYGEIYELDGNWYYHRSNMRVLCANKTAANQLLRNHKKFIGKFVEFERPFRKGIQRCVGKVINTGIQYGLADKATPVVFIRYLGATYKSRSQNVKIIETEDK